MTDAAHSLQEPSADRRRARGNQSRAVVLEHAVAIASTEGLECLTIGRLAAEAGVAKGNIQVLFGDKEALQLATVDWASALVEAEIVTPALAEPDPLKRLGLLVERWFAFVESRRLPGGCFMNALASEYRCRPGAVRDRVSARRAEKTARYAACVEEARAAGAVPADVDPQQVAFELLAFQAAANVAATIGDDACFARARETSLRRVAQLRA